MWNVKQITMHYQKDLPKDEQYFLEHPENEKFWSKEAFLLNFVVPHTIYFIWAIIYYIVHFKIKAK